MSFRKEKKYRVTKNEFHLLEAALYSQGMDSLYPTRKINSIYFDNSALDTYFQSEEGVLPRKKIRIRWYDNSSNFTLEKKTSSVEGRFKTIQEMSNLSSESEILDTRLFDKDYGSLIPVLRVSYYRGYYVLNGMRITFDSNISYRSLMSYQQAKYVDPERVIEIKVPIDCNDDFIEKSIPYPTSRFSKYARGHLFTQQQLSTV